MNAPTLTPEPAITSPRQTRLPSPELSIAANGVLAQGLLLLQSCGEKYGEVAPAPFAASIGQHYRHVLEHFHCLLRGATTGQVNYDARERDQRIETQFAFAADATTEVIHSLAAWTDDTLARTCCTVTSLGYHSDAPSLISSNLGRELAYCIGHAIHHFAIIRLLCSNLGVPVPADFGYAPSTLRYHSGMSAD